MVSSCSRFREATLVESNDGRTPVDDFLPRRPFIRSFHDMLEGMKSSSPAGSVPRSVSSAEPQSCRLRVLSARVRSLKRASRLMSSIGKVSDGEEGVKRMETM